MVKSGGMGCIWPRSRSMATPSACPRASGPRRQRTGFSLAGMSGCAASMLAGLKQDDFSSKHRPSPALLRARLFAKAASAFAGHALMPLRPGPVPLQRQSDTRQAETAEPIEHAGERVGLLVHADPVRVGEGGLRDTEQIED